MAPDNDGDRRMDARATLVRFKPAKFSYRHEGDYIERLEDIRLPQQIVFLGAIDPARPANRVLDA